MKKLFAGFGLAVCLLLLQTKAVWAQEMTTLTLNNADIMELASWAQDLTPKTIILHPAVQGKISVIAGDPMTRGEAFEVFLSILDINGFTAVSSATSIRIIPKATARTSGLALAAEDAQRPDDQYIVKVLKIHNVAAGQLVDLAKPLIADDGYIAAYAQTNSLIVIGRSGSIRELTKLVQELDKTGSIDIDMVQVQFASAKEVAGIVQSLIKTADTGNQNALNIAVDDRSNSLFITGDPLARQQIKSLITKLDKPLSGGGNTQVIHLSYATASEILPILSGVSGSEQENKKDSADKVAAVNIQADDSLNAVIITAPPSLLSTLKGVISRLDVRRGQVMVEAIIAEVNEDLTDSFGIEWRVPPKSEGVIGGFSAYPPNLTPLGVENGRLQLGTALSLGYLVDMDIRALINVLRGQSDANILSTPRIMALDNEEAQILVGENVPFVTGSQLRDGDSEPFQTIQRQDIGISLKIVPKINNENSVTLEIEQKVESIGSTDVETADIITNKREIKTRVIVDNGQMLVLGGLMRDETQISESKVPGLSRIPLLGRLFRSTTSSKVKRNLMVFIRPTILPDGATSGELSRSYYDDILERQKRFNEHNDRPVFPQPHLGPEMPAFTPPPDAKPAAPNE
jgi:general secretion pathway protein D